MGGAGGGVHLSESEMVMTCQKALEASRSLAKVIRTNRYPTPEYLEFKVGLHRAFVFDDVRTLMIIYYFFQHLAGE